MSPEPPATIGGVLWCAQKLGITVMAADQWLDLALEGMRLINGRTGEYVGPCPHCRAGRDRYHIWTQPGVGGRPAGRYWCRACSASGLLGDDRVERERDAAPGDVQLPAQSHATPLP